MPRFFLSLGSYIGTNDPDGKLSMGVYVFDGTAPFFHELIPIQTGNQLNKFPSWSDTLSNRSAFNGGEDYASAFNQAVGLLRASNSDRQVLVILTDGSIAGFDTNIKINNAIRKSLSEKGVDIFIVLLCPDENCLPSSQNNYWRNDVGMLRSVRDVYDAADPYRDWLKPLVEKVFLEFLPTGESGWIDGNQPVHLFLDALNPSKMLYVASLGDELPWYQEGSQVAAHHLLLHNLANLSSVKLKNSPDTTCQFPEYDLLMPEDQVGFFWLKPESPEIKANISLTDIVNGCPNTVNASFFMKGWTANDMENARSCYKAILDVLDPAITLGEIDDCIPPALCYNSTTGQLYSGWTFTPAAATIGDIPVRLSIVTYDNKPIGPSFDFSVPMLYEPQVFRASSDGPDKPFNPHPILAEDIYNFEFYYTGNLPTVYVKSENPDFSETTTKIRDKLKPSQRVDSSGYSWGCPSDSLFNLSQGDGSTSAQFQMLYSVLPSASGAGLVNITIRARNFMTSMCGFDNIYFKWQNGDHLLGVTWECSLMDSSSNLACWLSQGDQP